MTLCAGWYWSARLGYIAFLYLLQWLFTLKRKNCYFDNILFTGSTGSCHCDKLQYSPWLIFRQNYDISVLVWGDNVIWLFRRTTKQTSKLFIADPLCGEFTGQVDSPHKGPVMRSFEIYFVTEFSCHAPTMAMPVYCLHPLCERGRFGANQFVLGVSSAPLGLRTDLPQGRNGTRLLIETN